MKKTFIISTVVVFMMTTISVEAKDCSNYKTFSHKWNMCKVGKLPGINSADGETTEQKDPKKKGLWHKIRTFGGSERGSED